MLQFLRKGVKSLPAKILIGLLVASFAVWGIGDIFSFRLDSRVAKVSDTEIEASRFMTDLQREQNRLSRQTRQLVSYDMMRAAGIDRHVDVADDVGRVLAGRAWRVGARHEQHQDQEAAPLPPRGVHASRPRFEERARTLRDRRKRSQACDLTHAGYLTCFRPEVYTPSTRCQGSRIQ